MIDEKILNEKIIKAIESALSAKIRVEIANTKDGVKVYEVKRKEINS